jgi:hypothetical protein
LNRLEEHQKESKISISSIITSLLARFSSALASEVIENFGKILVKYDFTIQERLAGPGSVRASLSSPNDEYFNTLISSLQHPNFPRDLLLPNHCLALSSTSRSRKTMRHRAAQLPTSHRLLVRPLLGSVHRKGVMGTRVHQLATRRGTLNSVKKTLPVYTKGLVWATTKATTCY